MENYKIKILAIADDPDNLISVKALIKEVFPEATVFSASTGIQGLELAAGEDPDVILLDIILPELDGFRECTRLKADKKLREIPLVFITSLESYKENRIKALKCGAEGFLIKPIDKIELTAQIRAMLKIRYANRLREEISNENTYRFYALFNIMSSGVAIYKVLNDGAYGKDYIVMNFNQSALKIENKEITEVQGKSLFDLRKNIDGYGLIPIFQKVWKTGEAAFFPSKAYIDEKYFNWYENRIFKLPTGEIVAIYDDVTEKKLTENKLEESEERYRLLITQMIQGLALHEVIFDEAGSVIDYRFIDSNQTFERLTGLKREDIIGKTVLEVMPKTEHSKIEKYGHVAMTGESMFFEDYSEESGKHFEVTAYSPKPKQFATIYTDITERKRIEGQNQQNMKDLLESQRIAHLGTWKLNLATNEVVWSQELYKMYGFDPTIPPPPYTDHMKLFTPESWKKLSTALELTSTSGIPYEMELETVKADGSNGWMWVRGEANKDSRGNIIALWGAAQDISERKKNERELLYLSNHDHLTGLYNRRFFEEKLKSLDTRENLPLSIIMFDVNGLKLVNDSFGHDLGDMLLKKVAETINKVCREGDIIARIGGDEFVLLLPKTSAHESVEIANKLKELASKEKVANVELSISYGYDTKTSDSQPFLDIIVNAENHMYRHKLYERSSLRSKTIDFIMNTLFEKSNREAEHSNRVSGICKSIATKMNLDKDAVNQMRIAGLIHDIGKIGVDERILNKPGILTVDERRDIEKHPEIAWRLLSSTNEFLKLAEFILSHHEKWDGSGYPNGLKGEEIPLEARIIAIADSYDAMTSKRCYRKKLSKEEAIKELARCSGTQFDPDIVNVLVNKVLIFQDFM